MPPTPTDDGTDDGHPDAEVAATVREHRDALRRVAARDVPASKWARRTLALAGLDDDTDRDPADREVGE